MADLITAARTQIKYASNEVGGRFPKVQAHLDKAEGFLLRASSAPVHAALAAEPGPEEWSGTFAQALDRFVDALIAKQTADGVEVAVKGVSSGHAYNREQNIALATSVGVLDELGGPDFFGPETPGASL